jgi:diguanylate cyclase (GGDEF)-like protein/PAS domain S-box-containing protein
MESTKSERLGIIRVLLVADRPADVKLFRSMLDAVGGALNLAVSQVPRLEEALERLKREPQDVVLLDYGVADGGGLAGIERLRQAERSLPVILLADSEEQCTIAMAYQRGARDLLFKGRLEANLLARSIHHAAERRRAREAASRRRDRVAHYQSVLVELARREERDLATSLQGLVEAGSRALKVERVGLWLFNEDHSAIVCRHLYKLSQNAAEAGATLRARDYPRYFAALEESRVIAARDARMDPSTSEFRVGYLEPLGITSMMDVPVRLHGKLVGVLCHESTGPLREWDLEDQELASSISDFVSIALAEEERRKAEDALREERNFASAVLDTTTTMVVVLDPEGRIVRINRACSHTLGYPPEEAEGRGFCDLFLSPEDAPPIREILRTPAAANAPQEQEHSWVARNGARPRVAWSRTAILNPDGSVKYSVVSGVDVTERKSLEEQLIHDAFHDALTGLPNRALFMDRLGQSLRHSLRRRDTRFGVLFLDLDRFKRVNDSLGHMVGDQMLVEVARRLEAGVRPGDTAARLGGDEFTILIEDVHDGTDAAQVAERIQQQIAEPMHLGGNEIFTTASIGIALSETGYERPEDVLRDADIAMYRAKQKGGARHEVFDRAMHARAVALLRMETDLRRAIERGEFAVHYQPIVSLRDGRIAGFEALVRWSHPQRGLVPPGDFIRTAEETGLIIDIDRWVMSVACRQLQEWHRRYPRSRPLSVTVNLSCRQFGTADLCRQVEETLRSSGLHGDSLGLEITESALLEHTETTNGLLEGLRRSGTRLYLDDFGTGYSSLSYLHRFPIDVLKIDRSFVDGLGSAGEGHEIVRTIMSLAENLDIHVVAEGVETPEQLAALKALRCEFAQGYAFSRPVNHEAAEEMLAGSRRF